MSETFIRYNPQLLKIAYNILGDLKAAEDAVQDTFVKWFAQDTSHVKNVRAYLCQAVKNTSFNLLKQDKAAKHTNIQECSYLDSEEDSFKRELVDEKELSFALDMILQKLTAKERGVYLLREIFNFDYSEIADIFEKKKEHCRQLLNRAKLRLSESNVRFQVEQKKKKIAWSNFIQACNHGEMRSLISFLKNDIEEDRK